MINDINFRLVSLIVVIIIFTTFSIALVLLSQYRNVTLKSAEKNLIEKSKEFSVLANDFVENEQMRFRNRFYQNLRSFVGEDFIILSESRQPLVSTISMNIDFSISDLETSDVNLTYDYSEYFGEKTLVAISQMPNGGYAILFTSVDDIYSSYIHLLNLVYFSLVVSTMLGIVFAIILSNSFTKPLKKIMEITKAIKFGDYTKKTMIKRNDQIGQLAESIDSMSETIEANINEIKRLEEKSRELVANVSHEFKTPLTIINGYIHSIKDKNIKPSDEVYDKVLRNTKVLENLIDDLLLLNDYQSDTAKLCLEKANILDIINDVINQIDYLVNLKNIKIEIVSKKTVIKEVDYFKFRQLISILLDNAIKFSPNDSNIKISITNKEIKIIDNGIGIKSDELEKIFDRYYKSDNSKGGHGIGLCIAKYITEHHGFNLVVESEENKGTTVKVKF